MITAVNPNENDFHPRLKTIHEHVSGRVKPAIVTLSWAVAFVMLIVCANLSSLVLARTASREQEMAIRAAIGANRGRLVRQLFTEGILLTSAGVATGLSLTWLLLLGASRLSALGFPLMNQVHLDWRVLTFTLLTAVATVLLVGLAPAVHVSSLRLSACLGQRSSGEGHSQNWIRQVLVVAEVAFACILLVGSGLLVHSFLQVLRVDLGFRPESAYAVRIDPDSQVSTSAKRAAYLSEALRRVRDIPGVTSAGFADTLPLGRNRTWGAGIKGQSYLPDQYPSAYVRMISEGYLSSMGMHLKQGRDLTVRDDDSGRPSILINETMARTLFGNRSPLGQVGLSACGRNRTIVGVVQDVRHMALEKEAGMEIYMPVRQCGDYASWELVLRSSLSLTELQSAVYASIYPISPTLPRGGMRKLNDIVEGSLSPRRLIVLLISAFAMFALFLASLGIYGLISYSVQRRTREIGVRMALCASRSDLVFRILGRPSGSPLPAWLSENWPHGDWGAG